MRRRPWPFFNAKGGFTDAHSPSGDAPECLEEFPGYYSGPYGDLRKWEQELIDQARTRKEVKHQDQFFVPKEVGGAVIQLADLPGAGAHWAAMAEALGGSVAAGTGLEEVRQLIWNLCGLIRVFCKPKGRPVSPDAVVLPPGAFPVRRSV